MRLLASIVLLASAALPGFAAGGTQRLSVISPHWEGIRKEYQWAFADWSEREFGTRWEVEWIDRGGTSSDLKFVESEFKANPSGVGIDLFWGGGLDPYLKLADEGLSAPYRLPAAQLAGIPADYQGIPMYDPQWRWYGTALSGFGILYNKAVLRHLDLPIPRTWRDLADPRLTSWVGSADPRQSGSIHMMYEIILQAYGWDEGFALLTRMGANIRSFPKGGSQTPKDVAIGEAACGLAIDMYGLAQIAQAQSDELAYVWPEGETVINPDCISILKGAPHLEAAQHFVEFVMSPAGQKLLMLAPGESEGPREFPLARMAVRPALYAEIGPRSIMPADPFRWHSAFQYDPKKGGKRWTLVNDLIGATIIDAHPDLIAAWKALQAAGLPADGLAELGRAPLSEAEAMQLTEEKWKDQGFRNQEISRWRASAREQYRQAQRLAGANPDALAARLVSAARLAVPVATAALLLFALASLAAGSLRRLRAGPVRPSGQ
jgi:ABC-type Fe3+ transport system substrate-binding protein